MTTQTKTTWRERFVQRLYASIFRTKEKLGELPEGEKDIAINQTFLDSFLRDTREGHQWCQEAAMHWAEILSVPFTQMIITFDLGILAFIGVMRESFFNQGILILSIIYALASLLILTFFTRSVIIKNINNLAERVRILNYTIVLAPKEIKVEEDARKTVELFKKQGESLRLSLNDRERHVKTWMPWQKIGIYLFYASVLCVLIGIVFEI